MVILALISYWLHSVLGNSFLFIYFSLFVSMVICNVLFIDLVFANLVFHSTGDVKPQLEAQFSDRIAQLLIQL